jgi:hypothetical protein
MSDARPTSSNQAALFSGLPEATPRISLQRWSIRFCTLRICYGLSCQPLIRG